MEVIKGWAVIRQQPSAVPAAAMALEGVVVVRGQAKLY
jgi:hypothetical protein